MRCLTESRFVPETEITLCLFVRVSPLLGLAAALLCQFRPLGMIGNGTGYRLRE